MPNDEDQPAKRTASPLTPALSPLRGEGEPAAARGLLAGFEQAVLLLFGKGGFFDPGGGGLFVGLEPAAGGVFEAGVVRRLVGYLLGACHGEFGLLVRGLIDEGECGGFA